MPTHREVLLRHLAPTSDSPMGLNIERAEGVYMFGAKGGNYLNLNAQISVSNVR
jgi:4-aminobutyrate aminotransferase-like enzyme